MRKVRAFESIWIDGYFTDANDDISWAHLDHRSFSCGNIVVTYAT